jgi:hypothetical protein
MDVTRVLVELRDELTVLNAAIASLESLQHVGPRKKGSGIRKVAPPSVKRDFALPAAKARNAE